MFHFTMDTSYRFFYLFSFPAVVAGQSRGSRALVMLLGMTELIAVIIMTTRVFEVITGSSSCQCAHSVAMTNILII